jgi:hypothetical protein
VVVKGKNWADTLWRLAIFGVSSLFLLIIIMAVLDHCEEPTQGEQAGFTQCVKDGLHSDPCVCERLWLAESRRSPECKEDDQ